jgi:hypothetical protein
VGDAAGEEDVDDALGDGFVVVVVFGGTEGLISEEFGEGEAESAEEADVHEFAAGGVAFQGISGADRFHGGGAVWFLGWKRMTGMSRRKGILGPSYEDLRAIFHKV